MQKYIITGGPNAGKATVIQMLAEKGFPVLTKSSRIVIEQHRIMPWDNQSLFCEAFRKMQIERERELVGEGVAFLDRSLVDPIAYAEVDSCSINGMIYDNIRRARYANRVFFFEMLPEYQEDEQRQDSPEQALAVDRKLREVYTRLGFELIGVPRFSPDEAESKRLRMEFVLSKCRIGL